MRKCFLSKSGLKLLVAATLGTGCLFLPDDALATPGAGNKHSVRFDRVITGTVRDSSNSAPLAGATVAVKGGTQTASTDSRGAFTLTVPDDNAVIQISFVGYVTREVVVGTQNRVDITLASVSADLAQVVVVGYGTQNKKDITGSVKSVKAESFNRGIINSPQELLQGKVAGVNVTSASGEPGAIQGITVRGPGGVRTGSTPLFVIDGLPLDNSSTGGGDPLTFINPQDIESMDVLKDASATAIYGSRGANGVIIITTKKGRAGTSSLGFSSNTGFSKIARAIPVLTADEFRTEVPKLGGQLDDGGANTDWQDEITRTAITTNNNLTLSGGANKLTYFASFGVQQQQGILKNNDLKRYTGRFNASQKFLDDRLSIDVNLNVANTQNERPLIQNMVGDALANNPTYAAYGPDGKPAVYQLFNNPLLTLDLDKDVTTITRILGSISPSVKLVKGLVYRLNFGVDYSNSTRDVQALPFAQPQRLGRLETYNTLNRNRLIENYLTYNFKTGNHDFSVLAGHSYQKVFIQSRANSINTFPIGGVEPIYNPGTGQELTLANNRPTGGATINELQSYFGRVTYQFNEKYLLTANFRADGSSKFGENNKYGYFPSFSLGWKISEEKFMENSGFSNLKLRAGWGLTGNQEIPSKITQALFVSSVTGTTSYPLYSSGAYPGGIAPQRLANPDIQWEVSTQTNIGLDFGLLNGKLNGAIDVFRKVSNNILLEVVPRDPIAPVPTFWTNVEDMEITNRGLEIDLEYRDRISSAVNFAVGGNITFLDNNVENSPYTVIPSGSASGSGLTSATINGYINGQPIGTFFMQEFTGFDANGISSYRDTDKDGIVTDKDRIAAGTALPNVLYSFFGNVSYKGFDLNASFNGVAGNKVYDNTANSLFYKLRLSKNTNTTREAIADASESVNNAASVSTRFLKNGSWMRLNNLSLGYSFNTNRLGIGNWVKGLRLSVTGQNLFVITSYDGYDPEVNTDRTINGVSSYGIDYLSYPKAKSLIFGVNVTF